MSKAELQEDISTLRTYSRLLKWEKSRLEHELAQVISEYNRARHMLKNRVRRLRKEESRENMRMVGTALAVIAACKTKEEK